MSNLAIEEIYTQFRKKVASYIHSRICNHATAEDLVEDVFERIIKNIDRYDEKKASVSTWVYTITHNVVCNHYRKMQHKEEPTEEMPMEMVQKEDALDALCSEETLKQLAQALLTLPERERTLVVLRFYKGYSHRQTAQVLGISETNSKFLQNKAMKSLKKELGTKVDGVFINIV